jgi:hypothetical protein
MKTLHNTVTALLCSLVFLLPLLASSQIQLSVGNEFPETPRENEWFRQYDTKELWHYEDDEWKLYSTDACTGAEVCGDFIVVKINHRSWEVIQPDGLLISYYMPDISKVVCFDSLMVWEGFGQNFYVDKKGTALAHLWSVWCGDAKLDTLQSQTCYCVPQLALDSNSQPLGCDVLKNWGMLGTNAKWLIEPKFDQPFRFQDGFAEVLYYGEKRKINEKGEFVE